MYTDVPDTEFTGQLHQRGRDVIDNCGARRHRRTGHGLFLRIDTHWSQLGQSGHDGDHASQLVGLADRVGTGSGRLAADVNNVNTRVKEVAAGGNGLGRGVTSTTRKE